jgi:carbamoyl-phosphate synthase small subunit
MAGAAGRTAGWPAVLVLEDGTTFHGTGFGAEGETFGEMVFNTGMTGYQETLTDPSYCRQIVAMTAPHIGNTGVNDDDPESRQIWVSGYVVREPARIVSSWRARRSLDEELAAQGIPGIAITGTRALTRRLREHGAMRAAIAVAGPDPAELLARVLASPPMTGADLARVVSTADPYTVSPSGGEPVRYRVAAVDLGIKAATPRAMAARGCQVRVLPATSTAEGILATGPDGVFFSNGPGDPAAARYAVDAMRGVLAAGVPVFGICLGSQILGRALGLGTYKLRFGHRGINQPVKDLATGRVQITSHNHGFAVAPPGDHGTFVMHDLDASRPFDTAFGRAQVSHVNLNDGVVEGIRLLDAPAFSVQYHPEAAPGPHDAAGEFDAFCALMQEGAGKAQRGGGASSGARRAQA